MDSCPVGRGQVPSYMKSMCFVIMQQGQTMFTGGFQPWVSYHSYSAHHMIYKTQCGLWCITVEVHYVDIYVFWWSSVFTNWIHISFTLCRMIDSTTIQDDAGRLSWVPPWTSILWHTSIGRAYTLVAVCLMTETSRSLIRVDVQTSAEDSNVNDVIFGFYSTCVWPGVHVCSGLPQVMVAFST